MHRMPFALFADILMQERVFARRCSQRSDAAKRDINVYECGNVDNDPFRLENRSGQLP